jgi:AcrR family transcriptional regulator
MSRSPRKETQLDLVRQEILRAAARAAAQTGLAAVTLRDIAREAGYTVGTLYKYFNSKEAIEAGLIEQLREMVSGSLKAAVPAGLNFRQKVELLLHRQLTQAEDWREGIFAILTILPGMASVFDEEATSDLMNEFVRWLEANAQPSELHGADSLEVALFYFGVVQIVLTAAMRRRVEGRFVELVPRMMELFFHGIGDGGKIVGA